jgi:hypothetical protein
MRKIRNRGFEMQKASGTSKQHIPEQVNWMDAILALPTFWESNPPRTHPALPAAITMKDHNDTLNSVSLISENAMRSTGT